MFASATQDGHNKCVSRLARRESHHTALSNAADPNSDCPPLLLHAGARVHGANADPGSNATVVTSRQPKFTKMGEDLSG